jgi:adenylate kinase family enzyme
MNRIHVFGASGSGTTTLGKALANKLSIGFFDSDDYYWQKTDPPYRESYPKEQRLERLLADMKGLDSWILSGSILKWGDPLIPLFTLAVFVSLPHDLRLERLRRREGERYGSRIEAGGDMCTSSQEFLAWASSYDTAGLETRSLKNHQSWMKTLACPIIQLESTQAVETLLAKVGPYLNHDASLVE